MRRALFTLAALLATAAVVSATVHAPPAPKPAAIAPADSTEGTWTIDARHDGEERVQLNLMTENSVWGNNIARADLAGLSADALTAAASTPVSFRIDREPGVFQMEGTFREGRGSGHFRFRPNRQFPSTLRSLGVEGTDDVTDRELMHLALAGASAEGVRRLSGLGLGTFDMEDVMKLSIFDITPEYVREMRALGIAGANTVENVVEMRIHRLTPAFVREMESLGFRDLDREALLRMSIHGVSARQAREMAAVGFTNLSADDLVGLRIHAITPEYVRGLRAAGFEALSADDVTQMKIHRVTPELVRDLAALGFRGLDRHDLMQMGIHGVTPERIREYRALGFEDATADELVRMRIHGVTPQFIREVREAGFRDTTPDALVRMKIHGIGPEYVRRGRGR